MRIKIHVPEERSGFILQHPAKVAAMAVVRDVLQLVRQVKPLRTAQPISLAEDIHGVVIRFPTAQDRAASYGVIARTVREHRLSIVAYHDGRVPAPDGRFIANECAALAAPSEDQN